MDSYEEHGSSVGFIHSGSISTNDKGNRDIDWSEQREIPGFFSYYRDHSIQLVNALLLWSYEITFASCRYESGKLDRSPTVDPDIPYMKRMKKHLQSTYPQILEEYTRIDAKHKKLCNEIEVTMTRETHVMPYGSSFHQLITDKIESSCPSLRKSNDYDFKTNNIYLQNRIFARLFLLISNGKSTIELCVKESSFADSATLWYQGTHAIAQGKPEDMRKLKEIIEQLITDKDVVERIDRYKDLYMQLNDADIEAFRQRIKELYECIHGGQVLSGLDACDLCRPPQISP